MKYSKNSSRAFFKDESFEKGFFNLQGTYIHPASIIGDNVFLDENVKIGPFCVLVGNISIGSGSRLYGNVFAGMPAQDIGTKEILGSIEIGKNCEIREYVTISSPKISTGKTLIGDNCYCMNFSHIAHDVVLENDVILINNVNLGGHVHVGHHSMLMANAAVHQFCRVGEYASIAPFSGTRQDVPPFCTFEGSPAIFAGLNIINLRRNNFSSEDRLLIKRISNLFFVDKLNVDSIESKIEENLLIRENNHVKRFLSFIKNSERGISRKDVSRRVGQSVNPC